VAKIEKKKKKKKKKNLKREGKGKEGKSGGRVFNNKFLNIRERERPLLYMGRGWGQELIGNTFICRINS